MGEEWAPPAAPIPPMRLFHEEACVTSTLGPCVCTTRSSADRVSRTTAGEPPPPPCDGRKLATWDCDPDNDCGTDGTDGTLGGPACPVSPKYSSKL